jgi:lysophospholipid acyltransferase (LPLAT)-like uncharacterized protein
MQKRQSTDHVLSRKEGHTITAIGMLVRLMHWVTRYDVQGRAAYDAARATGRPMIMVFWHEDLINLLMSTGKIPFGVAAVMVSQSRDGERAARAVEDFGLIAVRGSSSHGGLRALIQMKKYLTEGPRRLGAVALDGPRGPRHEAKPGTVKLARMTNAFLMPIVFKNSREWVFRSWDRTRLIKPFAKMRPIFLPPIDATLWEGDDESLTLEVQRLLNEATPAAPQPAAT